jgi:hypothetical protein
MAEDHSPAGQHGPGRAAGVTAIEGHHLGGRRAAGDGPEHERRSEGGSPGPQASFASSAAPTIVSVSIPWCS